MAITVTFLSLASSVISAAETSTTPVHVGERTIVIITIWITVLLALLRKRARRTYKWINLAGKR
jgi:threonine/homoserine/homoserine lactone efflux protein